jgi:DNA mismatch repair protein MutS
MAGLPLPIIDRAGEILRHLESQQLTMDEPLKTGGDGISAKQPVARALPEAGGRERFQMSLFSGDPDPALEKIRLRLRSLDVDRMTPIEALLQLSELKRLSEEKS